MRILGHFSFIYVYMTTCFTVLGGFRVSNKITVPSVSLLFLLVISQVSQRMRSASELTQYATKTPFSLITSSLLT